MQFDLFETARKAADPNDIFMSDTYNRVAEKRSPKYFPGCGACPPHPKLRGSVIWTHV
jgi:hypothetical protein